jgi:hypothetical protein
MNEPMPQVIETDDEISLLDILQVIADNLRLLILAPLAAGLLALGITFTIPPTFTTTKFMQPQQQQSAAAYMLASLGALGGLAGAAIIGLGYVGLPLAIEFGKQRPVLGFDTSTTRIAELQSGQDHTLEASPEELAAAKHLSFSSMLADQS